VCKPNQVGSIPQRKGRLGELPPQISTEPVFGKEDATEVLLPPSTRKVR
jgi:hypothetical protein